MGFTCDALQLWGCAHLDHSKQSTQFCSQLWEWKHMKVELCKILTKVYDNTCVLKEHIVTNQVTQEHMYALHIQVKRMAKQIWEASWGVDLLINLVLKQMTLNIDSIWDFGMVLWAIPFNTLTIQDFYQSLHSFYIGMLNHLVKKYSKNNSYTINVTHSFKNFFQTCDFFEPLPGGMAQFTSMMLSIIRDMYCIDLDLEELHSAVWEMKLAPGASVKSSTQPVS